MADVISKTINTQIRKRLSDGTYQVEHPETKASQVKDLDKSSIGLSNVQNYGVATQTEAEIGTSNNKYMTPLRVKNAIENSIVAEASDKQQSIASTEEYEFSPSNFKKVKEIQVNISGRVRVVFDLKHQYEKDVARGRIYINDISKGTERKTSSTSYTTYTEDINVVAGDLVQLYIYTDIGRVYTKDFKICYSVALKHNSPNIIIN